MEVGGVATFWDAVTQEDMKDSITQLGYTLQGPTGDNKYTVHMQGRKIGTMAHEPTKAKWYIKRSITNSWFIANLKDCVKDKNDKNGVTVGQGSTSIMFSKKIQYESLVAQVEEWMTPLSTANPLEAAGGSREATRDKRFLVYNDAQNINDKVTVTVYAGRSKEASGAKRALIQGQTGDNCVHTWARRQVRKAEEERKKRYTRSSKSTRVRC